MTSRALKQNKQIRTSLSCSLNPNKFYFRFTKLAPRPIQSISCDVHLSLVCSLGVPFYWIGIKTFSQKGLYLNCQIRTNKIMVFSVFSFNFVFYLSPNLPQLQPSYYPNVFHGRILYYTVTIFTIKVFLLLQNTICWWHVTGYTCNMKHDMWHMTHDKWHVICGFFFFFCFSSYFLGIFNQSAPRLISL